MAARLNPVDRFIAWIDPRRGLNRLRSRTLLAHYEAAQPNPQRKFRRDGGSPNQLVEQGAAALRNQMRYLDRNHDLVVGSLDVLVNNTVGANGIGVEFQPRALSGEIHTDYAAALSTAWRDWQRRPEVRWQHGYARCQRLLARTLYRDGESFAQRLLGKVPGLDHGTAVPYSLELIEPDFVPLDYDDSARGIRQGIQHNAWVRPTAYWVSKTHPGEVTSLQPDLKVVPADRMLHLAHLSRIGQLRGVTRFASVIGRIEDIKDYEESERIAAKVAAMLTGYVKRQAPDGGGYEGPLKDDDGNNLPRQVGLSPGTIIDTLAVGEEIGLIDSKRPNPNLITFRNGQLRAFAAGISASYSSVSRNYDGTYSSQRQELVEQWVHYACLTDDFVSMAVQPMVEDFIRAADLSNVVPMPADLKPGTHDDVLYVAPSMPWIDMAKEATAWLTLSQAGFISEVEVIRKAGRNPDTVLEQIANWRKKVEEKELRFSSDVRHQNASGLPSAPKSNDPNDPNDDTTEEGQTDDDKP
ncbi:MULTISPECIES: phage portal protein [unclassified Rhizobacter]|uniref:phage portal protein n=1 Tax=unclassified Rhizobacter TaxID=2640088 RepID=UPI000ACE716B|nr:MULTISPECIES: phage portal protein [unclassified Rhizobacter]